MVDLPEFAYLLVNFPMLIGIPIVLFAALALWSRSVTACVAALAWNFYLIYELGMKAEVLCEGIACVKRTPLYVVYPLLIILSMVAVVQAYVHIRERPHRQRLQPGGQT
jgi:hypothetical protein